jgi:ubiquinone/menaquinone biosynthesis C-methylase UbiE
MANTIDPTRSWVSPTGNHYWYRKRREVSRLLERNVTVARGGTVVDFGTGTGSDIPMLASLFPDAEIVGLDARREDLAELDRRLAHLDGVRGEWADITKRLPFEDASVDLAYCSEVVEHIPDTAALFAEIHRVLKPRACFLMTTKNEPNVLQRGFWLRRRPSGDRSVAPGTHGVDNGAELHGHITLNNIAKWERTLAESGFELVEARRGALTYGGRRWLDSEGMLALYFTAEALMDLLPVRLSRRVSDQLIGLYRRV